MVYAYAQSLTGAESWESTIQGVVVQKLAEICIRRPVFAAMIVLGLVVVGAASYFRLQIDRNPKIDLPSVTVRTNLPGASPEEIAAPAAPKRRRRKMSPEARKRMSELMKKRWAERRKKA